MSNKCGKRRIGRERRGVKIFSLCNTILAPWILRARRADTRLHKQHSTQVMPSDAHVGRMHSACVICIVYSDGVWCANTRACFASSSNDVCALTEKMKKPPLARCVPPTAVNGHIFFFSMAWPKPACIPRQVRGLRPANPKVVSFCVQAPARTRKTPAHNLHGASRKDRRI